MIETSTITENLQLCQYYLNISGKIKILYRGIQMWMNLSGQAEDLLVEIFDSAKHRPSPIDAYFGGVYYIGPIFTAFRGSEACLNYYRELLGEVNERIKRGLGPVTPDGHLENERFRLVIEGPPNWTNFRNFWKIFYEMGAVFVGSTYTRVGGVYDDGFRHSALLNIAWAVTQTAISHNGLI